jgi:hypothetical protein
MHRICFNSFLVYARWPCGRAPSKSRTPVRVGKHQAASERLCLIFVPTPLLQTQMRPFTLLQLRRPEWTGVGGAD